MMTTLAGDFGVWARAPEAGGPVDRVAVMLDAEGTLAAYDAQDDSLTIGGIAWLAPGLGEPDLLPGGGSVTRWGPRFIACTSAAGDAVTIYGTTAGLKFTGVLSPTRPVGTCYGLAGAPGLSAGMLPDGRNTGDAAALAAAWRAAEGTAPA